MLVGVIMSQARILSGLGAKSVLSDLKMITLLNGITHDPNFIKENDYNDNLQELVAKATEQAYVAFGIAVTDRHNIKALYDINRVMDTNLKKLEAAMTLIQTSGPQDNKEWFMKVKRYNSDFEEIKERFNDPEHDDYIDRMDVLSEMADLTERFEKDLVSNWLSTIANSNTNILREILADAIDQNPDKTNMEFIQIAIELKQKYGFDIQKINKIPLSELTEEKLYAIINKLLEKSTPQSLREILIENIGEKKLLDTKRFSFDADHQLNKKKLKENGEKNQTQIEKLSAAAADRIAIETEMPFVNFETKTKIAIDDIKDLLLIVEPIAINMCVMKVNEYKANIDKLKNEFDDLSKKIKPDIIPLENIGKIDSVHDLIDDIEDSLNAALKAKPLAELKKYEISLRAEAKKLDISLVGLRDVNSEMERKVTSFNERLGDFINASTTIEIAQQQLVDREIDAASAEKIMQEAKNGMTDANIAICELRQMRDNLNKKDHLEVEVMELRDKVAAVQDKLLIAAVVNSILTNLESVMEKKQPAWHTVGLGEKLVLIGKAKDVTVANIDQTINAIYHNLKDKPSMSLSNLLQNISDQVLKNGSDPSIQSQLEKERPSFGPSHLSSKISKLCLEQSADPKSQLGKSLRSLDTALAEIRQNHQERVKPNNDDRHLPTPQRAASK
jgi:hypothetical protein